MNAHEVPAFAKSLRDLTLADRLAAVVREFAPRPAFSTSLGKEDQAISHAIFSADLAIRVFTLDTGRLFEETQSALAASRERYGAVIETYAPDTEALQKLLSVKGPNSFYNSVADRLECCRIRKVEPLQRALRGASAWITGLRAEQSVNRASLEFAVWDAERQLVKVNPVLDWSTEQLEEYIRLHNVPVNRLHAKGYPSIGCAPCTRPVAPGADARSGRWWWENPNKKECGLHLHRKENA
jgi:phosphoadenosine phosphosulfate reductase